MSFLPRQYSERYALLCLFLLVALVYTVAFPGSFFMDDAHIVKSNNLVYNLDIYEIFSTDYWGPGQSSDLFRPLTILSFGLNQIIFGTKPWGYLFVNMLLHFGVSALLFRLLQQFKIGAVSAWFAAALFAVHPLHAEAVIQLVGRSELLVALFGLLALILSARPGLKARLLTAVFFVVALLSKEHAIVLLALIPLSDLFLAAKAGPLMHERWRFYLALLLLTIAWLLYRQYVVHAGISGAMVYADAYVPLARASYGERTLAAVKLQGLYLLNFIWPFRLQGMYPASTVLPFRGWWSLQGLGAFSLLLGVTSLIIYGWRRRMLWALFLLFYAVSFAPTSNFFIVAGYTMADRVAYFPSLWLVTLLSMFVSLLPSSGKAILRTAVMGIVLLYFLSAGISRTLTVRTPESLWRSDLKIDAQNELSRLLLASDLIGQKKYADAESQFQQLLAIAPDFDEAYGSYADLLVLQSRFAEAEKVALEGAMKNKRPFSFCKIPLALAQIGLGKPDAALQTLKIVGPTDALKSAYWKAYGKAYEAKGDYLQALKCYRAEVAATGERAADAFARLGRVEIRLGSYPEAEKSLRRDLQINPDRAESWNALGVSLAQQEKSGKARDAFRRATELQPASREYRANLEEIEKRLSLDER